jgi:hypothetical protein
LSNELLIPFNYYHINLDTYGSQLLALADKDYLFKTIHDKQIGQIMNLFDTILSNINEIESSLNSQIIVHAKRPCEYVGNIEKVIDNN